MLSLEYLPRTREVLQGFIGERRLLTGSVGVRPRGGTSMTAYVGPDPQGSSFRWRLYCASKPLLAHTALTLMFEAGVSLTADVGELANLPAMNGISVDQLLSHTGGIRSVPSLDFHPARYRTLSRFSSADLITEQNRGRLFYSHTLAWSVLALVVEQLGGCAFEEAVDERTISSFGLFETGYPLQPEHTRSYASLVAGEPMPLRDKCDPRYADPNPSWGGSSTIEDVLSFYIALRERQAAGDPVVVAMTARRTFLGSEGRRPRAFGRGIFVDMQHEGASPICSERNFGHGASAQFGRSNHLVNMIWYDVAREAAFGIFLDGAVSRGDTRFPRVARALYADLEGASE